LTHSSPTTMLEAKRRAAFPTILGVAAIVFALDQAAKYLVLQYIPAGSSWSLFPALSKLFQLTHITNSGAAFGSFSNLGSVFKVVALVVIAAILYFYPIFPVEQLWVRVSLGLIVGGAMGNVLDRFVRLDGAVVDFIDIGFWPIGNIADWCIVIGVCILAYYLWSEENRRQGEALYLREDKYESQP
jgi:signal peptidase II